MLTIVVHFTVCLSDDGQKIVIYRWMFAQSQLIYQPPAKRLTSWTNGRHQNGPEPIRRQPPTGCDVTVSRVHTTWLSAARRHRRIRDCVITNVGSYQSTVVSILAVGGADVCSHCPYPVTVIWRSVQLAMSNLNCVVSIVSCPDVHGHDKQHGKYP